MEIPCIQSGMDAIGWCRTHNRWMKECDVAFRCPSCARLAAKLKDREGLAKVIYESDGKGYYRWEDRKEGDAFRAGFIKITDAVIRWMEGK